MINHLCILLKSLTVSILLLNSDVAASTPTPSGNVALVVVNPHSANLQAVPITSGVPFPRDALTRVENVRLVRDGVELPAQFRVAGKWQPGESIRWLLVDFQTDIQAEAEQQYALEFGEDVNPQLFDGRVGITRDADAYLIDTGAATFRISTSRFTLFDEVTLADGTVLVSPPDLGRQTRGAVLRGLEPMVTRAIPAPDNRGASHLIYVLNLDGSEGEDYRLHFIDDNKYEVVGARSGSVGTGGFRQDFQSEDGHLAIPADAWLNEALPAQGDAFTFRAVDGRSEIWSESIFDAETVETGPLRSVLRIKGSFGPTSAPVLEFTAWYHFYAGSAQVKFSFTLENNDHGGRTETGNADNADIGGINCVFFDEMALELPLEFSVTGKALFAGDADADPAVVEEIGKEAVLYQDSNGGEHWDRYRADEYHPRPNSYVSFKGYRISADGEQLAQGGRAMGLLALEDGNNGLYITVADFWQNFPKELGTTSTGRVKVGLFSGRYGSSFPFRSGEHKTHDLLFSFYRGEMSTEEHKIAAALFSSPLRAEPSPAWFAETGVLEYLYPVDGENYPQYENFNRSTIGLFPEERESTISLLSRREEYDLFGWMDYGDVPIDFESGTGQWGMKYDLDFHMARQYARSLHPRWFDLFAAAARHAGDIDVHHQPHYPGLHFVKGGNWAHSLHKEPGHENPNRNYNHFTKDLAFGARGTATLHYLTGDWKAYHACLEMAENGLARYMSPQREPDPAQRNRMGWRGDACTLNRLLEGYLLTGEEKYLERVRWVIKDCAFDGHPSEHGEISLWSSTFYMMTLARYVEIFPEDVEAKGYLLAHLETLNEACQGETCMLYTITPQPDGSVTGEGTTSMYNIMGADALTLAYLLTDDPKYMETARRCFAYGVSSLNWGEENPTFFQVHTANGAMHGNLFMRVDSALKAYEMSRETWGWPAAMLPFASRFEGLEGKVVPMGDSNTYANQASRWARYGEGKTKAEMEICRWMRSHEEGPDNGWWLAADDQPEGRSWTAASGCTSEEYLVGGKGGLPPLDEMLALHNPQIASILLGTNDLSAGVSPPQFLQNMRSIFEKCLANGTVPIAQTLPPTTWDKNGYLGAYNEGLSGLAEDLGLPLIDVHSAFLSRRPGDSWRGSLVSEDGAHLTHELSGGPVTPENLENCGHLLRCWLTVYKVMEIKEKVLDSRPRSSILLTEGIPDRPWFPKAPPLPPPAGEIIHAGSVEELLKAVENVPPGGTIMVADGHYMMPRYFEIRTDDVTLRGASGDRHAVIIDGAQSRHGEILGITACRGVTIADITIQNIKWNGFKINSNIGVQELTIYNCVIHNIWQRGVKGVTVPEVNREKIRPRNCKVQYCLFYNDRPKRYSDDEADKPEKFGGNYIGGIDVMYATNWTISDNVFIGIQGRTGEGRGGIFVWIDSRDCVIERNFIIDCDAGISLGNPSRAEGVTVHGTNCIIRNNFVTRAHENGIFTAYTRNCLIQHNTIHDPDSILERLIRVILDNENLVIANNLLSGPPLQNESIPPARLVQNWTGIATDLFVDPDAGDLHLKKRLESIAGQADRAWSTDLDIDGEKKGEQSDIGADEL
jgi:lysophospholipase L1-like esterase